VTNDGRIAGNYVQKYMSIKHCSTMLCADFIVPRIMNNLKVTFRELQILEWRYFYNVIPRANNDTECLLTLTLWCHPLSSAHRAIGQCV